MWKLSSAFKPLALSTKILLCFSHSAVILLSIFSLCSSSINLNSACWLKWWYGGFEVLDWLRWIIFVVNHLYRDCLIWYWTVFLIPVYNGCKKMWITLDTLDVCFGNWVYNVLYMFVTLVLKYFVGATRLKHKIPIFPWHGLVLLFIWISWTLVIYDLFVSKKILVVSIPSEWN